MLFFFSILFSFSLTTLTSSALAASDDFIVVGLYSSNFTLDSIEFSWQLPANSDYDGFEVSFYQEETNTNTSTSLPKNAQMASLNSLRPGTTVTIVVKTVKNLTTLAINKYTSTNELATVTDVAVKLITETTITFEFTPPKGFYTTVLISCQSEEQTLSPETNVVGPGVNQISCYFLPSGSEVYILIMTVKGNFYDEDSSASQPTYFVEKTKLALSSITYTDVSATEVNVDLTRPEGFFDFLEFHLVLLSTDSNQYFIDQNASRPNCMENTTISRLELTADMIQSPLRLPDLCPLSFWNGTVRTIRNQFESVEDSSSYRNGYLNVDCSLASLSTVGNMTTFFWPTSQMKVESYNLSVSYSSTGDSLPVATASIPFGNNSWTVYGLENNKKVFLSITVRNKNITSMACVKALTTGDPCSKYDDQYEISKITAPYPEKITIDIPKGIFTSSVYIRSLMILVGTRDVCEKETDEACYLSANLDVNEFYNSADNLEIVLPQTSKCFNDSCELKFVLDQDYYITLLGNGLCGRIVSNFLVVNVPSPFPLGTIVGAVIGASVFLVTTLLAVIIALTVKHVQKKHQEELTKLVTKTKYAEPDDVAMAYF